jgi:hypothetical protein
MNEEEEQEKMCFCMQSRRRKKLVPYQLQAQMLINLKGMNKILRTWLLNIPASFQSFFFQVCDVAHSCKLRSGLFFSVFKFLK